MYPQLPCAGAHALVLGSDGPARQPCVLNTCRAPEHRVSAAHRAETQGKSRSRSGAARSRARAFSPLWPNRSHRVISHIVLVRHTTLKRRASHGLDAGAAARTAVAAKAGVAFPSKASYLLQKASNFWEVNVPFFSKSFKLLDGKRSYPFQKKQFPLWLRPL